jgi:hypothetical protein
MNVIILNVTAVFSQVHCDAIGAATLAQKSGTDRIWLIRPSCLPYCRHVIDIDVEAHCLLAPHSGNS